MKKFSIVFYLFMVQFVNGANSFMNSDVITLPYNKDTVRVFWGNHKKLNDKKKLNVLWQTKEILFFLDSLFKYKDEGDAAKTSLVINFNFVGDTAIKMKYIKGYNQVRTLDKLIDGYLLKCLVSMWFDKVLQTKESVFCTSIQRYLPAFFSKVKNRNMKNYDEIFINWILYQRLSDKESVDYADIKHTLGIYNFIQACGGENLIFDIIVNTNKLIQQKHVLFDSTFFSQLKNKLGYEMYNTYKYLTIDTPIPTLKINFKMNNEILNIKYSWDVEIERFNFPFILTIDDSTKLIFANEYVKDLAIQNKTKFKIRNINDGITDMFLFFDVYPKILFLSQATID